MDNQIWGLLLLALMVAAAWYFQHDRQLRERLTVWQTTAIRDVRPGAGPPSAPFFEEAARTGR